MGAESGCLRQGQTEEMDYKGTKGKLGSNSIFTISIIVKISPIDTASTPTNYTLNRCTL